MSIARCWKQILIIKVSRSVSISFMNSNMNIERRRIVCWIARFNDTKLQLNRVCNFYEDEYAIQYFVITLQSERRILIYFGTPAKHHKVNKIILTEFKMFHYHFLYLMSNNRNNSLLLKSISPKHKNNATIIIVIADLIWNLIGEKYIHYFIRSDK